MSDSAPAVISDAVTLEIIDDVAVIRIDDGKANAFGHDLINAVHTALDQAESNAKAVLLVGRDGKFSAGFDLAVMTGGDPDAAKELLHAGAMLCHRLFMHPQPVVAAATGHALALGAILLMSCDVRFGAEGPYKIGTSEVAIGMQLPRFAVALSRERLSKRHFQTATQHATVYDPASAVDAGYLDHLHPLDEVEAAAQAYAAAAAAGLHPGAFRRTREYVRSDVGRQLVEGLDADMLDFEVPS